MKAIEKVSLEFYETCPVDLFHFHPHEQQMHQRMFWPYLHLGEDTDLILATGCGPGHKEGFYQEHLGPRVVGVDFSPRLIKEAKKNYPRSEWLVADMRSLPFKKDSFSHIIMCDCIEHIPAEDELSAMKEAIRVLIAGGILFLTTDDPAYTKVKPQTGDRQPINEIVRVAEILELMEFLKCSLLKKVNFGPQWAGGVFKTACFVWRKGGRR